MWNFHYYIISLELSLRFKAFCRKNDTLFSQLEAPPAGVTLSSDRKSSSGERNLAVRFFPLLYGEVTFLRREQMTDADFHQSAAVTLPQLS